MGGTLLATWAVGLHLVALVSGQCVTNNNPNCGLGAYPASGSTVYYAPSDNQDVTFDGQAEGSCDAGSSADVQLYAGGYPGTFITDCGCLPLDGNVHILDCAGLAENSLPEGVYNYQINLGPNEAIDQFTVTHTQVTSTVDGGTTTATVTTTETDTVTTTTTFTSTSTNPQITVTSPAATTSTTITVSPTTVTTTLTKTFTYTVVVPKLIIATVTSTKTAACTKASLKTCPTKAAKGKRELEHVFKKRQYAATGDGPLTTTVTAAPTVVTSTETDTTTETDTATVTTSTTVQPTPLTSTSYTGTTTNMVTVTLATPYKTRTRFTTTKVTSTKVIGFTVTQKVATTPACH